jgi:transposase
MNIVGIDVSKETLVGVRIDKSRRVRESFDIPNTKGEVGRFLTGLQSRFSKLEVVSESTAEYHLVLAKGCLAKGINFRLLNPILTKQFTRSTIRKKKTDLSDALIIAKLASQREGSKFILGDPAKPLFRTATKLTQIKHQLNLVEKRLQKLELEEVSLDKLAVCQVTLAQASSSFRSQALASKDPGLTKLLETIPGIGPILAGTLLAEIGNVDKFPSGNSLVAFAGLDPKVRQSGVILSRNTRLTKRGSPELRRAFYLAAHVAKRDDPELKGYFLKKRSEGRAYKEANIATARKICYRVYAVLKRKTPYQVTPAT